MDPTDALIALITSTGFVQAHCQTNFSPPVVEIDLLLGLSVTVPYDTYEQIREATGMPDHICD